MVGTSLSYCENVTCPTGRGAERGVRLIHIVRAIEILFVNFVLSGDNAIVLAVATARLRGVQRKRAILYGTILSILLRIWMTVIAGRMLTFPYVQAGGGVLLIYLALSLVIPTDRADSSEARQVPRTLWAAVVSVVLADFTMSLDNILALSGIAAGDEVTLIVGLCVSIGLIMFASQVIAGYLTRYRVLQYLGAAILAWTAGGMIGRDPATSTVLAVSPWFPVLAAGIVVGIIYSLLRVMRTNS